MIKKMGIVTVGVAAGLMAAAPFASASECHDGGHGGHDKGHSKHELSDSCNVVGGEAKADGGNEGDAFLGNVVAQAPIGGNNVLNLTCNEILNDNLSNDHVHVNVLSAPQEL
jgi:hypothetical protein